MGKNNEFSQLQKKKMQGQYEFYVVHTKMAPAAQ